VEVAPLLGELGNVPMVAVEMALILEKWHIASFRGNAEFRSLLGRSGHQPADKARWIGRE
jgi:hypothetical protein